MSLSTTRACSHTQGQGDPPAQVYPFLPMPSPTTQPLTLPYLNGSQDRPTEEDEFKRQLEREQKKAEEESKRQERERDKKGPSRARTKAQEVPQTRHEVPVEVVRDTAFVEQQRR